MAPSTAAAALAAAVAAARRAAGSAAVPRAWSGSGLAGWVMVMAMARVRVRVWAGVSRLGGGAARRVRCRRRRVALPARCALARLVGGAMQQDERERAEGGG